jgi:ABC-type multidrug transport system permease subunit
MAAEALQPVLRSTVVMDNQAGFQNKVWLQLPSKSLSNRHVFYLSLITSERSGLLCCSVMIMMCVYLLCMLCMYMQAGAFMCVLMCVYECVCVLMCTAPTQHAGYGA